MKQSFMGNLSRLMIMAVASGCTSVLLASEPADNLLVETFYLEQPWAQYPPVDIFRRVSAIQSGLSGVQNSLNAYSAAISAQAAEQNRRVFMQAELARVEAAQQKAEPRRSNFATRGTAAEIDAANSAKLLKPSGNIPKFSVGYTGNQLTELQAYELGVSVAEQSRASRGWFNTPILY